jgi:hypothetical protein
MRRHGIGGRRADRYFDGHSALSNGQQKRCGNRTRRAAAHRTLCHRRLRRYYTMRPERAFIYSDAFE